MEVRNIENFFFFCSLWILCREVSEGGEELLFDHGAPFFTAISNEVQGLVCEWESRGLVAEWKGNFGSFDCISSKFKDIEQVNFYCCLFILSWVNCHPPIFGNALHLFLKFWYATCSLKSLNAPSFSLLLYQGNWCSLFFLFFGRTEFWCKSWFFLWLCELYIYVYI